MTTTRIQADRSTGRSERRPVARALPVSVASASRHHDGGQVRVRGFDPAEQCAPVRHLVIFPARVV